MRQILDNCNLSRKFCRHVPPVAGSVLETQSDAYKRRYSPWERSLLCKRCGTLTEH